MEGITYMLGGLFALLFIEGLLFWVYFLFLSMLHIFTSFQINKIRKILHLSPLDYAKYWSLFSYKFKKAFTDGGLGIKPKEWSKVKSHSFKIDIDDMTNIGIEKHSKSLRILLFIHKLGFCLWILLSLVSIAFYLKLLIDWSGRL